MPSTVNVNNLTVVHKTSGGVATAFPDVCKTPAPAGPPIPLPYPNIAMSSDTASGSSTVKMDGNPIMIKSSYFAVSTGDEAGSALGVLSSKIKGKAYPKMYSFDVKVDGESVFRLTDIMCQNGGSPTNTPPASEVQAPLMSVMPPETDYKAPKITAMRWSKPEVVCGDPVDLEVTVENLQSSVTLQLDATVKSTDTSYKTFTIPVQSGSNTRDFITRQPPDWERTPEVVVDQYMFEGLERSEVLKFKTVPDAKELVGPKQRITPQFEQNPVTKVWAANGKNYGWEMCYEISIKDGVFQVLRKVDFALPDGASPSAAQKATWKAEIEAVWNRKFKIHRVECRRGDLCNCKDDGRCCVFPIHVLCEWGGGHGKKVDLHKGKNQGPWGSKSWWYSHTWWEDRKDVGVTVRAHEFGHLIGMFDEYMAGACDPLRKYTKGKNVMGSGANAEARHYQEYVDWFNAKTGSVLGETKTVEM